MDKLKLYWPHPQVQWKGRGISEAWLDAMGDQGFEPTGNPHEADLAVFISDSQLDPEVIGQLPTIAYFWGWQDERLLEPQFHDFAQGKLELMSRCTRVLVPSVVTYYQACHFGIPSQVCFPGVDTQVLNAAIPQPAGLPPQVLFISRLAPHKGLDVLIQAMSLISPRVPLKVIGPGDRRPYEELAKQLAVPCTFLEATDEEKVLELTRSSMLVHPSWYEGLSLPPLEALYCGVPVCVSDIPQHRHLLQEDAAYFTSVEGLAANIVDILSNPNSAGERTLRGQRRVRSSLTIQDAARRLWAHLHQTHKAHWAGVLRANPHDLDLVRRCYEAEHSRNWAYGMSDADSNAPLRFNPEWARHFRAQHFIKVLREAEAHTIADVGCVPAGYDIITNKGMKPIETVRVGEEVLGHDGRFHPVMETFVRQYDGPVLEIHPTMVDFPVALTPEHPVLVIRLNQTKHKKPEQGGPTPQWVPASEVKTGDYVVLPRVAEPSLTRLTTHAFLGQQVYATMQNGHVSTRYRYMGRRKLARSRANPLLHNLYSDVFTKVAGFYVSEGSRSNRYGSINFAFGPDENVLAQEALGALTTLGIHGTAREKSRSLRVTFSSAPLHRILTEQFGIGAARKRIPPVFFRLGRRLTRSFLDAALRGDGYVGSDQNGKAFWSYSTVSKDLAFQLMLLWMRQGRVTCSLHKANAGPGHWGKRTIYTLTEARHDVRQRNFLNHKRWAAFRVARVVSKPYKGPVYNLAVEGANSYVVEGVTVHNCGAVYPTILAKAGFEVYAVDIAQEALNQAAVLAQKWGVAEHVTLRRAEAQHLPFPDGHLDAVVLGEILEHVPDPEVCIKEALRVVKPGGHVLISTPYLHNHYDPFHIASAEGGWSDALMDQLLAPWRTEVRLREKIAEDGVTPSCYLVVLRKGREYVIDASANAVATEPGI